MGAAGAGEGATGVPGEVLVVSPRRVALASALVLVLAAPAAGQKPQRVQTQQYLYTHGVDLWHWKATAEGILPPIVFTPRPGDRWLHLAVDDVLEQPVFLRVRQDAGGRGEDLYEHFCDAADILRLVSEEPVEVYVFTGLCANHTTGFASTGTLTATFARNL